VLLYGATAAAGAAEAAAVSDSAAGAGGARHLGIAPAPAPTPPVSKASPGLSTAALRSRAPTEVPAQMRRP